MIAPQSSAALGAVIDERFGDSIARLQELVAVPSVSADGGDPVALRRTAELVRDQLLDAGLPRATLLEVGDGPPCVFGESDPVPGQPTVLLYAHYDVQPEGPRAAWSSDPYAPTIRDGRLYGRGAADDKAGIVIHLAALDAWRRAAGGLPLQVKVLVEGEEECGSRHLPALLAAHADALRCDVIVVPDSINWRVGEPILTTSLRGVVSVLIELRALQHPLHSGIWGGAAPDPVAGMCVLVASLVDEHGRVLVPGFEGRTPDDDRLPRVDVDTATLGELLGVAAGAAVRKTPGRSLSEQLWEQAAMTIIGMDVPAVLGASNTIQASCRARVSVRLPPDADADRSFDALRAAIERRTPRELAVTVTPVSVQRGWRARTSSPAFAAAVRSLSIAYGAECRTMGLGATVPFIHPFLAALDQPDCLLTGVGDPSSNAHAPDESVLLDDVRRAAIAEALLLGELAGHLADARQ